MDYVFSHFNHLDNRPPMMSYRLLAVSLVAGLLSQLMVVAHDGPDPMGCWLFSTKSRAGQSIVANQGPNLKIVGAPKFEQLDNDTLLRLDGRADYLVAEGDWDEVRKQLPSQAFTITLWAAVDRTQPNGGLVAAFQDNGGHEKGWVVGYNEQHFTFGLSTVGSR